MARATCWGACWTRDAWCDITKLLNATKFALSFGEPPAGTVPSQPLDLAMLARLDTVVADATAAFEDFDYTRALERTEDFFWWFCDDYVELVKSRAYGASGDAGAASALAALATALSTFQRLFAPLLPFVTEEVWSWWQTGSVHRAAWPVPTGAEGDQAGLDAVCEVLAHVRRAKTEAKVSQRAAVGRAVVSAPAGVLAQIRTGEGDLREAGSITTFDLVPSEANGITVTVELAAAPAG